MTRSASNIHDLDSFTPSFGGRADPGISRRHAAQGLHFCLRLMLMAGAGLSLASPPTMPLTGAPQAMPHSTAPPTALNPLTAPGPSAASIQHVTLERDCHGCASSLRLELPRGGPAVAHQLGKARHRTEDSSASAALPAAEFEALAQALVAAGFFSMADTYQDENLADGAWAIVTVRHAGGEHRVFRREDAGPEALKALEAALDALQARLLFVPDKR
jgi:hypothetical protein